MQAQQEQDRHRARLRPSQGEEPTKVRSRIEFLSGSSAWRLVNEQYVSDIVIINTHGANGWCPLESRNILHATQILEVLNPSL